MMLRSIFLGGLLGSATFASTIDEDILKLRDTATEIYAGAQERLLTEDVPEKDEFVTLIGDALAVYEAWSPEMKAAIQFNNIAGLLSGNGLDVGKIPSVIDFDQLTVALSPCMKEYGLGYFMQCAADSGIVDDIAKGKTPFSFESADGARLRRRALQKADLDNQLASSDNAVNNMDEQIKATLTSYIENILGAKEAVAKEYCEFLFGSSAGAFLQCFEVIDVQPTLSLIKEMLKVLDANAGVPFAGQPQCADLHLVFELLEKYLHPQNGQSLVPASSTNNVQSTFAEFELQAKKVMDIVKDGLSTLTADCKARAPDIEIADPPQLTEFLADPVANPSGTAPDSSDDGSSNGAAGHPAGAMFVAIATGAALVLSI